jgi:Lrp/AsnC family transcriptional regulator, leucine-responsive regulatory protein
MIKLTKADRILLTELEYNSKISEKKLAELCHLSKDSIRYRIKRLEKLEVIKGYSIFLDHKKLGKESYKLYLKLNATLKQKQELINYLKELPNTFGIFESYGDWNFAVALFAENSNKFNKIENDLLERFGEIIIEKRFCSMIEAQLLKTRILLKENRTKIYNLWGDITKKQIDEKDKTIIKELYLNSRSSLVELSSKIKLSIDSTKRRLLRLLESKIIMAPTTKINYEVLGFDKYKLFIYPSNYSNESERKIISFLKSQINVINIIKTIGPWKLEVEFLANNQDEIEKTLSKLNEQFPKEILNLELSLFRNEQVLPSGELLLD